MLSVSPKVLQSGGKAEVGFGQTDRPVGETVTVTIDDGGENSESIEITLTNGQGTGAWCVPAGWTVANFNAPGCQQVTRFIEEGIAAGGDVR